MHLITGLLVAGLLGRKKKGASHASSPLLRRGGPVEPVHLLPGRVRFRVDALKGRDAQAEALAQQLGKIEDVESVEVSSATGSVLICYRGEKLQPELLLAAIVRLLGLERELERSSVSSLRRGIGQAADSLNDAVYAETHGLLDLWTLIPLAIGVLGVQRISQQGLASLPGGFTLLWWAYVSLIRPRENK